MPMDNDAERRQIVAGEEPIAEIRGRRFRWWRDLDVYDAERLQGAMDEYAVDMEARAKTTPGTWMQIAAKHLQQAEHHKSDVDRAWPALKAAQRELVDTFAETELLIEADRLAREAADKLHGWRLNTVVDALAFPAASERLRKGLGSKSIDNSSASVGRSPFGSNEGTAASAQSTRTPMQDFELADLRDRVKAARRILDEGQDNVYRKLRLLRGHLIRAGWVLGAVLLLVLIALIFVLWRGWSPSNEDVLLADSKSFIMVMALGALGAALSGVLTLLRPDSRQRIPDVKAQRHLVWLRPVIGAGAAVIVVAIFRSGLGGLSLDPEAALVAALIAGSSERLVSRAVASASAAIIE